MTDSALGMPLAVSVVPSSGSTAMSASGGVPSPMRSPLKSIGASSFSPSPITTTPSMWTVSSTRRMASTAAWSAASLSPRPTRRAAASDAASVTRTSSSARLRSGRGAGSTIDWLDHAGRLARALDLRRARGRADAHQDRPEERYEGAVLEVCLAAHGAGLAHEHLVGDEAEGGDGGDGRHLAAGPRQGVAPADDPREDQR